MNDHGKEKEEAGGLPSPILFNDQTEEVSGQDSEDHKQDILWLAPAVKSKTDEKQGSVFQKSGNGEIKDQGSGKKIIKKRKTGKYQNVTSVLTDEKRARKLPRPQAVPVKGYDSKDFGHITKNTVLPTEWTTSSSASVQIFHLRSALSFKSPVKPSMSASSSRTKI